MKSLLLTLFALPMAAQAAPEISVGVSGGVMVMDPLEVLDTTWIVVPRLGYGFNETLGLELDVGYQAGKTRIGDFNYTGLTPRLNLVGKIWTKGIKKADGSVGKPPPITPLLVAGIGGFYKATDDGGALGPTFIRKDLDFLVNAGPGLLVPLGNTPLHLRTDLRWVLNFGNESFRNRGDQFVNWEWTAGLGASFGGVKDSDKDGIVDEDDGCPNEAEDIDEFEDSDGCPDPDNDNDGVLDADDKAPTEAEDKDGFEDEDGVPDPDNDGDEVLDVDDTCPDEAGSKAAKGCPDADGDGIIDSEDECEDEAGPESAFGCPDSDEDRVPTYRDDCPDEKGPAKADPKRSDGCPHKVYVTADAIKILDKVYFDTGKATIKSKSFPLLDEIGDTLKKFTGIKKVDVEGHTDNTGDPEKNQALSEARAASVMTYLIEKDGIDAGRLNAVGFGQTKPLDPETADTTEGRTANRRVEFHITEQEAPKTILRRQRLEAVDAGADAIDSGELVATVTKSPAEGIVRAGSVCTSTLTIDKEGKVTKATVTDPRCDGLGRSVTHRVMEMWEFEPVEVDGKVVSVTTEFEVTYPEGKAMFKHNADKLTVLETEDEPEEEESTEDEEAAPEE